MAPPRVRTGAGRGRCRVPGRGPAGRGEVEPARLWAQSGAGPGSSNSSAPVTPGAWPSPSLSTSGGLVWLCCLPGAQGGLGLRLLSSTGGLGGGPGSQTLSAPRWPPSSCCELWGAGERPLGLGSAGTDQREAGSHP